mgnify:CR=1 FL=1
MKKEKILKVVRIALLVILCLFAVKFFIGKNINGDNDNILTAATKKAKVIRKITQVKIQETEIKKIQKRKNKKQKFRKKSPIIQETGSTK